MNSPQWPLTAERVEMNIQTPRLQTASCSPHGNLDCLLFKGGNKNGSPTGISPPFSFILE